MVMNFLMTFVNNLSEIFELFSADDLCRLERVNNQVRMQPTNLKWTIKLPARQH